MTLPASYFEYPFRRPGMDHARYAYSNLFERKPVQWPGGARVALWIVPTLEFFPLDMAPKGVKPPGGLERPYPDYWNYTLRDYGNRVGFARIFRALEERGLQASVAMSSRLAERYPHVLQEVNRLGFELRRARHRHESHPHERSFQGGRARVGPAFALDPAQAVGSAGQRVVFAGLFREPRHARSGRRRGLRVRLRLGQ